MFLFITFKATGNQSTPTILSTEYSYVENNSVISKHIPLFEKQVSLASLLSEESEEQTLRCIIQCESGFNIDAEGDNGEAKGILQFHYGTFKGYCVDRYGYRNDWLDPDIQINCYNEMVKNGGICHWSCANECGIPCIR